MLVSKADTEENFVQLRWHLCRLSEEKEKQIYFAAVRIQRSFRGYRVRKTIKQWNKAATMIQKHVRGWLVRWHLPELYAYLLDLKYQRYYNTMATKIQALWRGYSVGHMWRCLVGTRYQKQKTRSFLCRVLRIRTEDGITDETAVILSSIY